MTEVKIAAEISSVRPHLDFLVRQAVVDDAKALADLWCRRKPQDRAEAVERARRAIAATGPEEVMLAADLSGTLVAYGRISRFRRPEDAPGTMCPSGWYLLGITVREDSRRRGIGRELTRRRLEWLRKRGIEQAWYFTDFDNERSIRLHEEFGFEPVRKDVIFPGMRLDSQPMVLFGLTL